MFLLPLDAEILIFDYPYSLIGIT